MGESNETFNWPDGDVVLRAYTHGAVIDSRDFRVHKLLLSLASPVFKDMFQLAQPTSTVDTIDVTDPPRAVEAILRFIYPNFESPTVDDLTMLSEVLAVAEKYDVAAARSRFRQSLVEFAKAEPLRVYAIACKLGYEDEMKIASTRTISTISLPRLTALPEEFKFVPATEYHRLIHLHARYRKKVEEIAEGTEKVLVELPQKAHDRLGIKAWEVRTVTPEERQQVVESIRGETLLNYESLAVAVGKGNSLEVDRGMLGAIIHRVLKEAEELSLTV